MSENQDVTPSELAMIRQLGDFDLQMLISEIHDHGWVHPKHQTVGGRALLPMIWEAHNKRKSAN